MGDAVAAAIRSALTHGAGAVVVRDGPGRPGILTVTWRELPR